LIGIPLPWSGLLITLLTAAFSCGLAATLCCDKRVGWAMATLTPINLLNTTMVMNEAAMTICILSGLILALRKNQIILASTLLGMAALIRPMGGFAACGLFSFYLLQNKNYRNLLIMILVIGLIGGLGMMMVRSWAGDSVAASVDTYNQFYYH